MPHGDDTLLVNTIKQSKKKTVLIGTTTPLMVRGHLESVIDEARNLVTLIIKNPEALGDGYSCRLGDYLYLKNTDLTSFGRFVDEDKPEEEEEVDSDDDEYSTDEEKSSEREDGPAIGFVEAGDK